MSQKVRNVRGAKVVAAQRRETTGPMPNLSAGQVICPVCEQPGIKMVPDDKPGVRYQHAGRLFLCRDTDGSV